jgi:hypothetical protein
VSAGEYLDADNIVDALTPREQHVSEADSVLSPPPQRSTSPQQLPPQSVKLQPQVVASLPPQKIEDTAPVQVSEEDMAPKLTVGTAVQPSQPFPQVYTKPPASCGMLALRGFSLVHIALTIASSIAVSSLTISACPGLQCSGAPIYRHCLCGVCRRKHLHCALSTHV